MKLLIVGSTGLVGRHALALALAHPKVDSVIAPGRRAPTIEHPKLQGPRVDFDALPTDASWWQVDAVVCALGTTMRLAGSEDAFRRVDQAYPLAVARLAHRHGASTFVLNSAMGADVDSRLFYSRVKGEVERDLATVGFGSLVLVRPGLIGGQRDDFRMGERAGLAVLSVLGPVLPRRWRINPDQRIAQRLVQSAVDAPQGVHIVPSDELV